MRTKRTAKFFYLFIGLLMLVVHATSAQQFQWQAALPATPDSGFYKIPLTREFIAKSNGTDLRDIRIYDQEKVVSYILSEDSIAERLPVPVITWVKDAPAGYSILQLQFKEAYLLKRLKFEVTTSGYYFRLAYITTDWTSDLHADYKSIEDKFKLSTESGNSISLHRPIKTTTCFLVIRDDDNQPLVINSVQAMQETYYLTTWLEKGKHYVIKTGNPEVTAPKYDLPHFTGKVPVSPPVLVTGNIKVIPFVIPAQSTPAAIDKSTLFKNKGWVWASLIGITTLILLLTMRLLKDMREKK